MPAAKGSPSQPDQNEQNSKLTDGAYFLLDGYVSELDTRCRSARAASAPSPNQTSPTNSAEEAFFLTTHDVSRTCIDVVDRVGAGYIQQSRKYPR